MTRCRILLATAVLLGGPAIPGPVAPALVPAPAPAFASLPHAPAITAELQPRPPGAPGVDAFPLVAEPGPAAERINRATEAAERRLRSDIAACRAGRPAGQAAPGWTRTVAVTGNGPVFLSFLADDRSFCGGPYPNADRSALVFDLRSGKPADWQALLPNDFAVDVSPAGLVRSLPLMRLYRRHYPAQVAGIDPAMRDTCRESVENGFTLWPDLSTHALMIQPTPQNHAAAACAVPVALTPSVLREAGAPDRLLEGLGEPLAETTAAKH